MAIEPNLPVAGPITHRPGNAAENAAFEKLPDIALVVGNLESDLLKLAEQCENAKSQVVDSRDLHLLTAGPILDGPDTVRVQSIIKAAGSVQVVVRHTSARIAGTPLRRNIRWRPLLQIPLQLPPGKVEVKVEWVPFISFTDEKAAGPALVQTAEFEITLKE